MKTFQGTYLEKITATRRPRLNKSAFIRFRVARADIQATGNKLIPRIKDCIYQASPFWKDYTQRYGVKAISWFLCCIASVLSLGLCFEFICYFPGKSAVAKNLSYSQEFFRMEQMNLHRVCVWQDYPIAERLTLLSKLKLKDAEDDVMIFCLTE